MLQILKRKYKLWKAKRLTNKISKTIIKMGVTQKELQNIAEDIQKQIREQKHLERIMKHGYDMQQWKYKTCFNQDNSLCQDCISGGSMLWAYCNDMEEEYNKFFKKSF